MRILDRYIVREIFRHAFLGLIVFTFVLFVPQLVRLMELLVRHVPVHMMARGQGYYTACSGIISSCASILSGAIYARYGQGVYYLMAVMAGSGALLMWLARHRLAHHPQSAASGG